MYKFLITILTSSDINLLKSSYNSVKNQINTNLNYDILIVVNTLDDNYYNEVKEYFKDVAIIRTPSNGKPGKGHNSILNLFYQYKSYDYLIPIDGDDFLYPNALARIEIYLKYKPDILMLPYNDILGTEHTDGAVSFPILNKCYLNYNNIVKDIVKTWNEKKISPFKYNINMCNTPGRLLLLSRKSFGINLHYDENLKWYDDFIVFIQAFEEATLSNNYNIFMVDDCDIYLYNRINPNSVSEKFKIDNEKKQIEEEKLFRISVYNKYLAVRNWDISNIKRLKADYISTFLLTDKLNFAKKIVTELNLPDIEIDYKDMNHFLKYAKQENLEDLQKIYQNIIHENKDKITNIETTS